MPHCRPMMNVSPQMTSVLERISTPAWRSASPKYLKTLRPKTSLITVQQKRRISPKVASQSRGIASQPLIAQPAVRDSLTARSLDVQDVGVGGEQRLREHVVEREHAERRD